MMQKLKKSSPQEAEEAFYVAVKPCTWKFKIPPPKSRTTGNLPSKFNQDCLHSIIALPLGKTGQLGGVNLGAVSFVDCHCFGFEDFGPCPSVHRHKGG